MRLKPADPITEQLLRLDDQLRTRRPLVLDIWLYAPVIPAALGLILGIALQQSLSLSWYWGLAGTGLAILGFFLHRILRNTYQQAICVALVQMLLFASLGMLRLVYLHTPYPDDIRLLLRQDPYPATLRGTIVSEIARENRKSWFFGDSQFTEPARSFYLSADSFQSKTGGWQTTRGIVRVQVSQPAFHIQTLDRVELYCIIRGFSPPANPGQFDFQSYMHNRGVYIGASVETAEGITVLDRPSSPGLRSWLLSLKNLAWTALIAEMPDESDQRTAMAAALLLGFQQTVDYQTNEAFIKTGLSHIISLSGMHLAIIAAMVWWIAKIAGLEKRKRAILTLIIITLYALIVPPRAPTLRSVFIFWVFCTAILFRRKTHPVNTLAVTAIALLFFRPTDLFYPDWQLSYGTILGILLLYHPILKWLQRYTLEPLQGLLEKGLWRRGLYGIVQLLTEAFSVGFAAWFGGAGILLWSFGSFTPLCSLWTVLVSPIVPVILYLGFFKILLARLFPTLSSLLGWIIIHCSDLFIRIVQLFAALDFTSLRLGPVSGWVAITWYVLVLLWLRRRTVHSFIFKIACIILATGLIGGLYLHLQSGRNVLTCTCLAVGHGQAIVVQTPDRESFLFDTGSITNKDPGIRTVVPFLKQSGIQRLDAAFISHGDLDHFNGLPEIVATDFVRTLYASDDFLSRAAQPSAPASLIEFCTLHRASVQPIPENIFTGENWTMQSLWPDRTNKTSDLSDNDQSQVWLITCAGKTILLCGDIETYAQEQLVRVYPDLKVDVIVLPHHGSTTNLSEAFIRQMAGTIMVASCAQSRLASVYKTNGTQNIFYTGLNGAVEIKIKADGTLSTVGFVKSQ